MEGVVIRSKKTGGTVTVSVVSDAEGHYGFPGLAPSRSAGYDLTGHSRERIAIDFPPLGPIFR
jgi:hypothetical protein